MGWYCQKCSNLCEDDESICPVCGNVFTGATNDTKNDGTASIPEPVPIQIKKYALIGVAVLASVAVGAGGVLSVGTFLNSRNRSVKEKPSAGSDTASIFVSSESKEEQEKSILQQFDPVAFSSDMFSVRFKPGDETIKTEDGEYVFLAEVENKSDHDALQIVADYVYLDGFRTNSYSGQTVDAGETVDIPITVKKDDLDILGYYSYSDIGIHFMAYNLDVSKEAIENHTTHIYPYGKERAEVFSKETEPEDVVLMEEEEFALICTRFSKNDSYNSLHFYITNKSDTDCVFTFDQFTFDDLKIEDAYQFETLEAGCSMEAVFNFSSSSYGDLLFDDIEEISFGFGVKEESSEETLLQSKKITFHPVKRK